MAHRPWPGRRGRQFIVTAFVLALAATFLGPGRAVAAPAEASLSDVFTALRVSPEPADYVLIVDTSASMADKQDRYGRVRSGLSRMAQALRPDDRVAVITFDAKATLRRPLTPVGSNRSAIVASLPATPSGQATDIGRAISSALDLMQHSSLRNRAAVLLFTDGRIDTDKGSPYATATSPGWSLLKQQASSLQAAHAIAPLAIALASDTDAAVLKKVFSNVTDVSANDLGSYLSQVSTEVMKAAAVTKVKGHLGDPVTATWQDVPSTAQSGASRAKLVLHNSNPVVPVEVTGLRVRGGSGVTATGLPSSLSIPPGGTASADVSLGVTGSAPASLTAEGTVSTPWRDVITHDLGLDWSAKLTSDTARIGTASSPASPDTATPTTPTTSTTSGSFLRPVGGALAVLVLLALVVVAVRALRRAGGPELTGTLSILRNGRVIDERLLRGRSATFTVADSLTKVSLRGTRNADGQPGVRVSATAGKVRSAGTLFEGDTLALDGVVVTYTSDRTRMLRLIGTD